LKICRRAS